MPFRGHPHRPELLRIHGELHKLWTAAVGTPGYNKQAWQALEKAISDLARATEGRPR